MSSNFTPSPLFERVERMRRRKPRVKDDFITLAHGSGGRHASPLSVSSACSAAADSCTVRSCVTSRRSLVIWILPAAGPKRERKDKIKSENAARKSEPDETTPLAHAESRPERSRQDDVQQEVHVDPVSRLW